MRTFVIPHKSGRENRTLHVSKHNTHLDPKIQPFIKFRPHSVFYFCLLCLVFNFQFCCMSKHLICSLNDFGISNIYRIWVASERVISENNKFRDWIASKRSHQIHQHDMCVCHHSMEFIVQIDPVLRVNSTFYRLWLLCNGINLYMCTTVTSMSHTHTYTWYTNTTHRFPYI